MNVVIPPLQNKIFKEKIETIQVNLGNLCNQVCAHCHVQASPKGDKNMDCKTAEHVLNKLLHADVERIEFTGGAPEMNPYLKMFIEGLSNSGKQVMVRTNLTVLGLRDYSSLIDIYRKNKVRLIASLPSVFEDSTDRQRGKGVFLQSINMLKKLNGLGFGTNGLSLDLVYNPSGDFLPPSEVQLEAEYRQILQEKYAIQFNKLFTMVNVPLARFRDYLMKQGAYHTYMELLKRHYNPSTLDKVMCRKLITVNYCGDVYDCDFNLAVNRKIKGYENCKFWEIDLQKLNTDISFKDYCYACTVNSGSSCQGVLLKDREAQGAPHQEKEDKAEVKVISDVRESVQEYYGKEVNQTGDLKTNACCTPDSVPSHIRQALMLVHEEIKMKYYGCGNVIPSCIEGLKILDIGCGTGRDTYVMAKLAGEHGFVYGLDMTKEQIAVAKKHITEQTIRFGYSRRNVAFIHDYMEHIEKHFEPESVDLVTSNCVINLAEDKESIIRQVYKVLKYGGEFYFSDVYADRRIPEHIQKDHVLYGECLGGALYYKDFERIARKVGFADPRVVSRRIIEITDPDIKKRVENITFCSITYRLWKIQGLEDACEDYGHIAIYKGGIPESPYKFELDGAHLFEKNRPEKVCGNTVRMLSATRFKPYFEIVGSFDEHFGLFKDCGTIKKTEENGSPTGGCC